MSLYDHVGPSIVAEDLARVVRRLRKHNGMQSVPILVVEGPTDEGLFAPHCSSGARHVFAAGTRGLVEQLLIHLRTAPITGCACVFLTDCDARGKAAALKHDKALVVTTNCDLEADLVELGTATCVVTEILRDGADAASLIDAAVALASPVSHVRRAAAVARVTFKRSGGARLMLRDLDAAMLLRGIQSGLEATTVVDDVAHRLGWSPTDKAGVDLALPGISTEFREVCSGKDVLDAAWILLERDGRVEALTGEAFHRRVRSATTGADLERWDVARRIRAWQHDVNLTLLG